MIEEAFQVEKDEAGLEHWQVRHNPAWYRHTILTMTAADHLPLSYHRKGDAEAILTLVEDTLDSVA
ncbi:hypothetical protein [Streptomyces tendae]